MNRYTFELYINNVYKDREYITKRKKVGPLICKKIITGCHFPLQDLILSLIKSMHLKGSNSKPQPNCKKTLINKA